MKIFLAALFLSFQASAEIRWPEMSSAVVDEAGILSSQEKYEIENWIHKYRDSGKAQLQVVIVKDLQGLPIEDYSIKLVEQWKLGNEKRDDGVLFIVSTTDRKMRIEVGQGLEGALTDLQSKRILDDRVKPLFKSGQYAAGIAAGVSEIIQTVDPEYFNKQGEPAPQPDRHGKSNRISLIVFLLFLIFSFFGRRRSGIFPFLGGGGGWGGSGGGGGSAWSGGGGGFSGGGASSDW